MKYAAIKSTPVDFDISRGTSYEESIRWFDSEKDALHHYFKNPNCRLIRYEDVSFKLVAESDLASRDD